MLSKLPIHKFLFSLFPIMFFFQGNLHEIPFEDVTFPLFLSISITFLSWIILRKFIGSQRSGLILSLVIMSFINLGNIRFFILFLIIAFRSNGVDISTRYANAPGPK